MVLLSALVWGSNNVLKKWIFLQGFGKCGLFLTWLKAHGCVVVSRVGGYGCCILGYWECHLFCVKGVTLVYTDIWLPSVLCLMKNQWTDIQSVCEELGRVDKFVLLVESHIMVLCSAVTVLLAFARRWERRSVFIENNNSGSTQLGTGSINLMRVFWARMAELMVKWLREHIFLQGTHSCEG